MDVNLVFSILIYVLVFILIAFIIKVYISTLVLNKNLTEQNFRLTETLKKEEDMQDVIMQKTLLVDSFSESFFNRLFKITKELLLAQKLMFKKDK